MNRSAAGRGVLFDVDGTLVDTNYLHVLAWRRVMLDRGEPEIRAFPRAADLLRALHGRGVRVVLATSAEKSDLEALLEAIDAEDAIDAVTSAGEVEAAKPAPDLFCVALEEAGTKPEATVVVGDTVWDVKAAARAGLPCVAVLSGGISRAELADAGAVAIYDDVADLLENLDQSPLLGSTSGGTSTASSPRRTE